MTADKVIEVKAGLTESKVTHSLSQISQNEKEKNEEGTLYIYRKEKRAEDEVTPSSETGPTADRHVSWALNASWIKELPK